MKRSKVIKIALCVVIATVGIILGACSRDNDSFERLSAPQNLRVEDGALVWDEVEHASGYAVYIENDEHLTIEPRFDLSELTEKDTTYVLFVIAIGDGKHYSYSDEAKYSYAYTEPEIVATPNLAYKLLPDGSGYEVSRGNANLEGRIVIPDYYEGLPVKKIAEEGFWRHGLLDDGNKWTTGVRLPNTLEEIGYRAFNWCVALTEVEMPDSVTKIGEEAFYRCSRLKRVSLPSTLYELPDGVFNACNNLEDMTLPSGLKKIGASALWHTNLSNITIPDGVCEIGAEAFEYCGRVTKIKIPDGVTRLEDGIFSHCSSLEDITFPKNIEYFGRGVVYGTKWLANHPDGPVIFRGYLCGYNGALPDGSELTIPTEVECIAGDAFAFFAADNLTITVPDGVALNDGAFADCRGLTTVRLPFDLTYIPDYAFERCDALVNVVIHEGVTEIGDGAFLNCKSLQDIELPTNLKKIGDKAFQYTNLAVLRIPESVTEMGDMPNSQAIKKIILSPELAATAPWFNSVTGIFITCTPEQSECDYVALYKEKYDRNYSIYLYVQDEQDLPDDGGNYWHYDEDGKTPVIWQV